EPQRGEGGRLASRAETAQGALLHARHRAFRRGAALSPHRTLRLSKERAGTFRRPAALAARAAREAGTTSGAGGRHAHRCDHRRPCASRRRNARGPGNRGKAAAKKILYSAEKISIPRVTTCR